MNGRHAIVTLTDPALPASQRESALRDFAERFGWRPSDALAGYPGLEEVANGHLVVEHGLDNTAVISFLRRDRSFEDLSIDERAGLLGISYNNLVDWHILPDINGTTAILNRRRPLAPRKLSLREMPDVWHAEAFERITANHPIPNLKNLDQALIDTIAKWKRFLAAELEPSISIEHISALFNAIFFVRALEDHRRAQTPNVNRVLLEEWHGAQSRGEKLNSAISHCLGALRATPLPLELLDVSLLAPFDALDSDTVTGLLRDFYDNPFAPYHYDFSLMSKHALSRIYEKYVGLLRKRETGQRTLFSDLPEENRDTSTGSVYTPQYIARFFARFVRDNSTPRMFRALRVADPACGSGIFLRTMLEMQCDPFRYERLSADSIYDAFARVLGIDVDANACHATRLSLALLHLVLTGEFPRPLQILPTEAIEHYQATPTLNEAFDVVITNPPYIKWDHLNDELRKLVADFLGESMIGKPDMYLPFLQLGLEMLRPGGMLLFVLPHSFLIARNAALLRKRIAERFWVRCVVDLSEIQVFEDVGSYVMLLILQRPTEAALPAPNTTVVRCREFVGHALCDALEGRTVSNDFYEVFEADRRQFSGSTWAILSPEDSRLRDKLLGQTPLGEFLAVRLGLISGADDVFIVRDTDVPEGEDEVYVPFLADREMARYRVPSETGRRVFYPYLGSQPLGESDLKKRFPKTWKYLVGHRSVLESRQSVIRGDFPWWRPERPRTPETLLVSKIITPHLVVMPRFSFDETGKYAVSRSPLMHVRHLGADDELLRYILAVLNSLTSLWQIVHLSHKYSRGYAMLEPKTLRGLMVPDPSRVPVKAMSRIQRLVSRRLEVEDERIDQELERLVADLYGLTKAERLSVGMEA